MNELLIFATTFFAILKIILVALGGFILSKKGIFHKQITKDMGKVIFQFMIPCMIFGNIIDNVDIQRAKMVGILFLFPIITHIIAFSLGQILRLVMKFKPEEEEYLLVVAGSTFGNHGNIAVPLLGAILNDANGPFSHVPNAKGNGTAYVMVYMSMCSVLIWGVGMPWFRSRNNKKKQKQKEEEGLVEMQQQKEKEKEKDGEEKKADATPGAVLTPGQKRKAAADTENLLKAEEEGRREEEGEEEEEGGVIEMEGEYRPDGPPSGVMPTVLKLKSQVLVLVDRMTKTYVFELLTLPPVFALTLSLIIAFIAPLRNAMVNSYLSIITNTASFIGDASIPIILMFLGANLADKSKEAYVPKKITISVVIARLVVLPTIGISIVYLLIKLGWLPDDIILHFLLMVQFAMPSAVNLILACQVAGGGEAKMSSLLFWQYVVCSFTISVFCILIQFILL